MPRGVGRSRPASTLTSYNYHPDPSLSQIEGWKQQIEEGWPEGSERAGMAWTAVKSALGLIRRNLGATALQWLLLAGLGIAWRIALVPVNLVLVFVSLLVSGLPALLLAGLSGLIGTWMVALAVGLIVFIPLFLLLVIAPNVALDTLATVFYSTTWTLTYRELVVIDSGKPEAKLAKASAEDA